MLLMLLACTDVFDPNVDGTSHTGTVQVPTVDPEVAVVDVTAEQDGPDVVLTFVTATAVTRAVEAVATWSTGDVTALHVGVEAGLGEAVAEIPAPCATLGTVEALVVQADGLRFGVEVALDGQLHGDFVAVNPHSGLSVACTGDDVLLDAVVGSYELRAAGALVTGFGTTGKGSASFAGRATLALDGRYTVSWREEPYHVMVRPVEAP